MTDLIQPGNPTQTGAATEATHPCRCLDIGVGANCIYPITEQVEYGWTFVGSDTDPISTDNAQKIVTYNPALTHKIELRL